MISLRQNRQQIVELVKVTPCFITWLNFSKKCAGHMPQGDWDDTPAAVYKAIWNFQISIDR